MWCDVNVKWNASTWKPQTITERCKTDVTPAILSRDFVAQLYRATKLQHDQCCEADDSLFNGINNSHHVLHRLLPLPSQASHHYSLRSRRHNLQLSITPTSLIEGKFLPTFHASNGTSVKLAPTVCGLCGHKPHNPHNHATKVLPLTSQTQLTLTVTLT